MATKKTSASTVTKADLEARIAQLEELLAAAQQKNTEVEDESNVEVNVSAASPAATAAATMPITFTIPSTDVTVVYCSDSLGHASISNMDLNFNRYGEEFIMSRTQFDELVGKYRRWFDNGILAVAYKDIKVAAAKGLKTDREIGLDATTLESIGSMSCAQIEKLWDSLTMQSHRESVVSYFKRKFIEGDASFTDRAKIDLLNRLTDGGFKREQDELSGRYKISPTEM